MTEWKVILLTLALFAVVILIAPWIQFYVLDPYLHWVERKSRRPPR